MIIILGTKKSDNSIASTYMSYMLDESSVIQ